MQNIKQFVKERQEIKSLQTCESHFFHFSNKNMRCRSYKICPTKNCPSRYEVLPGHRRFIPACFPLSNTVIAIDL